VLKYEHFRINIVVAAYPAFVYVVSRAGRQVDCRRSCAFDAEHKYVQGVGR